jgi:hypothetical protein
MASWAGVIAAAMLALAGEALASPRSEQTPPPPVQCVAPAADSPKFRPGVVARSPTPRWTVDELAQLVAPVLWFSADEPLIIRGATPLPNAHPCDQPTTRGVVYYQVLRVRLRGKGKLRDPVEDDPDLFAKAESVVIRFYFYYVEDIGLDGHVHDLEGVEFLIDLDREPNGCGAVRVERVVGLAHGVEWYWNRLEITADAKFPITILVEEGKHSDTPDRNADGHYMPGYDVNIHASDAWGVRDVLGSGFLGASNYESWMTKPRTPAYRMLPPDAPRTCDLPHCSSLERHEGSLGQYELRRGSTVSMAKCAQPPPHVKYLEKIMSDNDFGSGHTTGQFTNSITEELSTPLTTVQRLIPSVALRYDQGYGIAATLPGYDVKAFYLVPKLSFVGQRLGLEGLMTRSAARFASMYVAIGAEELDPITKHPGDWSFVSEGGFRFRYRLSGWWRIFGLGYQFAGVRFGVRMDGVEEINNIRLIAEFGAGVW